MVLDPLLFFIYINEIVLDSESIIKPFVDNIRMYAYLKTLDIQGDILNSDTEKVSNWAKKRLIT